MVRSEGAKISIAKLAYPKRGLGLVYPNFQTCIENPADAYGRYWMPLQDQVLREKCYIFHALPPIGWLARSPLECL